MLAKELIYNIRTNFDAVNSSIKNYTDQHIMYMLDEARAILASRKMDAKVNVEHMSQFLDVKPSIAPLTDIGTVGNKKLLKLTIPSPIAYLNGGSIFTVGPTDGRTSYTRITFGQLRTALSRKYTGNTPKWLFFNNAVYLVNTSPEDVSLIRVYGIFDQPYKIAELDSFYSALKPFEFKYPLSMKDAKTIYELAFAGDLGWGDSAIRAVNKYAADSKNNSHLLTALKNLTDANIPKK